MERSKYVRFFDEIGIADVPLVGGANAALGEMHRKLSRRGVRVPNGFAITAEGYRHTLEEAGAWGPLHCVLDGLNPDDVSDLARRAKLAWEIVYGAGIPDRLAAEIRAAYGQLCKQYGDDVSLEVRASPTDKDLPLPSSTLAEPQETFLNVKGEEGLLDTCRRCFASLFTDRAIRDRIAQSFDHFKAALSISVLPVEGRLDQPSPKAAEPRPDAGLRR